MAVWSCLMRIFLRLSSLALSESRSRAERPPGVATGATASTLFPGKRDGTIAPSVTRPSGIVEGLRDNSPRGVRQTRRSPHAQKWKLQSTSRLRRRCRARGPLVQIPRGAAAEALKVEPVKNYSFSGRGSRGEAEGIEEREQRQRTSDNGQSGEGLPGPIWGEAPNPKGQRTGTYRRLHNTVVGGRRNAKDELGRPYGGGAKPRKG